MKNMFNTRLFIALAAVVFLVDHTARGSIIVNFTNFNRQFSMGWVVTDSTRKLIGNGEALIRLGAAQLSAEAITQALASGDLAKLNQAFTPFGDSFPIGRGVAVARGWFAGVEPSGRPAEKNVEGLPIDIWLVIGGDFQSPDAEHLYLRHSTLFPVDDDPLIVKREEITMNPSLLQVLHGQVGRSKHDFELGGGEADAFSTEQAPEPSTGLLAIVALTIFGTIGARGKQRNNIPNSGGG